MTKQEKYNKAMRRRQEEKRQQSERDRAKNTYRPRGQFVAEKIHDTEMRMHHCFDCNLLITEKTSIKNQGRCDSCKAESLRLSKIRAERIAREIEKRKADAE